MNRAMRRAKKRQPAINKSCFSSHIKTLFSASTKPLEEDDVILLTLPFSQCLADLKDGLLTSSGFVELNEFIVTAFNIAREIWLNSPQHSKELVEPSQEVFERASQALESIGWRCNRTGKLGATGDEINALVEAQAWHRDLIQVSTCGIVLKALIKAEEQVTGILDKRRKTA